MADIDSLAAALFGPKRAETQEVLTDATTRTYMGTALTDSEGGTVMVDLGGDVTLPDDVEGVSEHSAEGIEVSTGPGVRAGDEVVVTLVGGTPLKTPMVTGVAGEGDDQDARIATASAAAEEAWQWADEAHTAATDAQASASAAQESASSAASAASSAVSSAARAEQSAQQAVSDASAASQAAGEAKASAQQAVEEANEAHDAATAAQSDASRASQSATEAKGAATRANTAANDALAQVATVEDVIGVVDWVTEHGTYSLTTDTTIDPDKVYYTRSGSGTQVDPYLYAAVPEPVAEDLGTYYELSVQEALSQYVASHLALTDAGLYILKDGSGYRLLLANDGMQVIDPAGHTVATYGESITFDSERPQRIGGTNSYIEWRDTNGDGVPDSLVIVADSIELGSGQSVSTGSGNVWANHTSATSASGISSWSDSFVAPTTAKPYVWMKSYSVINGERVYGNPACISGATGQQGPQGPQGKTGETGVGIESYAQMWAKSTSKTTVPTSGWSESRPTSIGTNEYLWVRIDTTWTDGSTTQGVPAVDQNTTDLWHTSAALRVNVDSIDSDVDALKTTVSGHTTTIQQNTTSISQNTDAIALRATKTEVQQVRPAYASSSTAAGTAAKVATIDPAVTGYALYKGASVAVTFSKANTAATPTLNLNSTGAKQIRSYTGAALSEAEYKWAAGSTIDLVYDGTYWRMQDGGSVKRVTAAEASIKVNADNIESKVSKDGVISSINQSAETVKIDASKVEIDGTAVFSAISSDVDDAITSKGYQTSSQVNSAITSKGYATTTQAQGYATTAKSEAISAAATDATTKANAAETNAKAYTDALEIGGRNLLPKTGSANGYYANTVPSGNHLTTANDDGECYENSVTSTSAGIPMSSNVALVGLDSGSEYTLSMMVKSTVARKFGLQLRKINNGADGGDYVHSSDVSVAANTWTRLTYSFTGPSDALVYARLYVAAGTACTVRMRELQLERGNKATDWSPAPEDTPQYRVVTTSYSYTLAQWLTYAAEGYTGSWTTGTYGQGVRAGDTVMLKGINKDNGSAVYVLMTVNTLNTSGAIANATSHGLIDPTAGQRADSAQSTANAAAPKANAVKRTQRIWYRTNASSAPSTPGTASSNWVTKADDGNDAWTKMHIAISSTHKYIYTCEQYEMANGTVGYTSVLLDNTITVIDGGNIITGSVTANKLNAANINASKTLTVGAMTDAAASTILNSNMVVGGRNLLQKTEQPSSENVYLVRSVITDGVICTTPTTSDAYADWKVNYLDYAEYNDGEYTVSVDVRLSASSNGYTSINSKIYLGYKLASRWAGTFSSNYDRFASKSISGITNEWNRVSVTFKVPNDLKSGKESALVAGSFLSVEFYCGKEAAAVDWRHPKLEKGNKATDWTPAPEDVESSIIEASKTASNYITADSTGIKIHMSGSTSTYQHQSSTATTYYVNGNKRAEVGASGLKVYVGTTGSESSVAEFGTTARVGSASGPNVYVESGGVSVRDGTTGVVKFTGSAESGYYTSSSSVELDGWNGTALKMMGSASTNDRFIGLESGFDASMSVTNTDSLTDYGSFEGHGFIDMNADGLSVNGVTVDMDKQVLPAFLTQGGMVTQSISATANAVTSHTVTFPIPYETAPIVVACFYSTSTAAAFGGLSMSVSAITTTSFTVKIFNNTSTGRTLGIFWLATPQTTLT